MVTPEEHAAHDAKSEKRILSDVKEHGFHIALYNSDGYSPSFAHTIGLYKTYGYPELICLGFSLELLHSVLWEGKRLLDKQPKPDPNVGYSDFLEGFDVRFITVDEDCYPDYFGYAGWFYKSWDFPALQVVWPDKQALYPWDEGFNSAWKTIQPLLDRNSNFKFREERNAAVFTTRQVLEGSPILRVIHEANGDWQFLCDTSYDIADLKVVRLDEIAKRDPTLNELFQLNYGWQARRIVAASEWQKEEHESAEEDEEEETDD
jgi:hypothetical protein